MRAAATGDSAPRLRLSAAEGRRAESLREDLLRLSSVSTKEPRGAGELGAEETRPRCCSSPIADARSCPAPALASIDFFERK